MLDQVNASSRPMSGLFDDGLFSIRGIRRNRKGIEKGMKAIQVKQPGGFEAMKLVDLPIPEPKPNEALVKTTAAGVNFVDVYNREGRYKVPLPFVLGQEAAGTDAAAGSGVTSIKVGDRVAYTGIMGSYSEYNLIP